MTSQEDKDFIFHLAQKLNMVLGLNDDELKRLYNYGAKLPEEDCKRIGVEFRGLE